MHKLSLALITMFLVFSQMAHASDNWGYTDHIGQQYWGSLGYPLCSDGKQQSPINFAKALFVKRVPSLDFQNKPLQYTMQKDEHNLYAYSTDHGANTLQFNGETYFLQSFHFHTPGEHRIEGKGYPLEGHFIHENSAGKPVVVGVFFKLGAYNPEFEKFIHAAVADKATLDISQFLPKLSPFYSYAGSLTVPPCTEGLTWVVLIHTLEISRAQLTYFKEHVIPNNTRSPQALDGRVVTFHRQR